MFKYKKKISKSFTVTVEKKSKTKVASINAFYIFKKNFIKIKLKKK